MDLPNACLHLRYPAAPPRRDRGLEVNRAEFSSTIRRVHQAGFAHPRLVICAPSASRRGKRAVNPSVPGRRRPREPIEGRRPPPSARARDRRARGQHVWTWAAEPPRWLVISLAGSCLPSLCAHCATTRRGDRRLHHLEHGHRDRAADREDIHPVDRLGLPAADETRRRGARAGPRIGPAEVRCCSAPPRCGARSYRRS